MATMPEVGGGATIYFMGQYFPATITRVTEVNGEITEVYVQEDSVLNEKTGGVGGQTDYEFAPNLDFGHERFSRDSNGRYSNDYALLLIGPRRYLVALTMDEDRPERRYL